MEDPDLAAIGRLLAAARTADPGWSTAFGGPDGIALAADASAEVAARVASDLLSLRTAALAHLMQDDSLREVARRTGINRSTISKAHRAWVPESTPFAHLINEESW